VGLVGLVENLFLVSDTVAAMTKDASDPTGELKKVPLFIADVSTIADEDVDEWARKMAEHASRAPGFLLEDDDSGSSGWCARPDMFREWTCLDLPGPTVIREDV